MCPSTNFRKTSNSTTNTTIGIKRRKGGENTDRTSKCSYPPNLPLIEEAPGSEPNHLRL
jgi:hypothetical protein